MIRDLTARDHDLFLALCDELLVRNRKSRPVSLSRFIKSSDPGSIFSPR